MGALFYFVFFSTEAYRKWKVKLESSCEQFGKDGEQCGITETAVVAGRIKLALFLIVLLTELWKPGTRHSITSVSLYF